MTVQADREVANGGALEASPPVDELCFGDGERDPNLVTTGLHPIVVLLEEADVVPVGVGNNSDGEIVHVGQCDGPGDASVQ